MEKSQQQADIVSASSLDLNDAEEKQMMHRNDEQDNSSAQKEMLYEKLKNDLVYQSIQELLSRMQDIQESFTTKVKYDTDKTRLIDILHKELQDHREGLHFKILRPILMDLIAISSDMDKVIDDMQTKSPEYTQQAILNLRSFQESIEELLERHGVETFQLSDDTFVASMQRVVNIITTHDPVLDKKICRRVRKGFRYDNRILRPELVDAYKFVEITPANN